jgi:hypothetical protein
MSGALSGLMVGFAKSEICRFRKQNGLKTLTPSQAYQSDPRRHKQQQDARKLSAWEAEWSGVVDNYWTQCTPVVIAKMGDPEMRKLTNAGVHYHLNPIASKERSRINAKATWNRNKGNRQWMDKRKAQNLAWASKNKHRLAEARRQWVIDNPVKWKKAKADQRRRPEVKVRRNIRKRMRDILGSNSDTFAESVGCTPRQLKMYLEGQFTKQMSWENYGTYWHIDHIHPLASFNLFDSNQRRTACNFNNLRPLSAKENMEKSDRITVPQLHLCLTA